MRPIDVDVLIEYLEEMRPQNLYDTSSEIQEQDDWDYFKSMIDAFPTIRDIVAPVKCCECKYNYSNQTKDKNDMADYSGDDIVCTYFMTDGMKSDDYCSYGEKKEG